jgi:hypothetical protein
MFALSDKEIKDFLNILKLSAKLYAVEELTPKKLLNGHYYVLNIDDDLNEGSNGTHWTAFFLYKDLCLYFDSFGNAPPEKVKKMIQKNYIIIYNGFQLQDNNKESCGYYAIYFIWAMVQIMKTRPGKSMSTERQALNKINQIIKPFDLDNIENNEAILKGIINKMLK